MQHFEKSIEIMFSNKNSSIAKDLQLNLKKYLTPHNLTQSEIALVVLSLSSLFSDTNLKTSCEELLKAFDYTQPQVLETLEIGAFVAMLNSYYKFKHFVGNSADYAMAGLRMNAMMKPSLTKAEFELLALVHSLLNSCEFCVKAHEHELRKLDVSAEKIHDAVRLTSVLKAVSLL